MTAEKFKRKLAAILSADVKGYSRLVGEEGTIRILNSYLEIITGFIQQHRGNWTLAATYSMMGLQKEARAEAAEVLRINPKSSADNLAKTISYKDQSETIKSLMPCVRRG